MPTTRISQMDIITLRRREWGKSIWFYSEYNWLPFKWFCMPLRFYINLTAHKIIHVANIGWLLSTRQQKKSVTIIGWQHHQVFHTRKRKLFFFWFEPKSKTKPFCLCSMITIISRILLRNWRYSIYNWI